jgi:hypothetical protein
MNDVVRNSQAQTPTVLDDLRRRKNEHIERRKRLIEFVETGGANRLIAPAQQEIGVSPCHSVHVRITELDEEVASVEAEIDKAEKQLASATKLPDRPWITSQIQQLPSALLSEERKAAVLLGELLDEVHVHRVVQPGKKRGYQQLRFRLKAWKIINAALDGRLPENVVRCISSGDTGSVHESPEFCLDVGGTTRWDQLTPYVVKRRREKAKWREICEETGLTLAAAYECWRRYTEASKSGSASDEAAENDTPGAADVA